MDYTNAMILWDAVCVRVTDVRHERLNGNNMELTEESPFFLFISGKNTRVTIADKPYTLGGDTMFQVARGRRVVIEPSGKAEYRCVAYQTEAPQAVGREMMRLLMEEKALDGTLAARPIHSADVLRIYDSLEAAWSKRSPLNCIRAKEAFYALLCEFYAALAQPERTVPIDAVEWTRRTLQAHFSEDISILRLAKALGVSRSSLHVQFSRRLGVSPQQYLTELRLEAAQRALRETACPVQEIVTACGLKDKNHFYTLYRNRFGMTPGEYRRQFPVHLSAGKTEDAPNGVQNGMLIENFGRIHHYRRSPEKIVCLDYAAAEICAALGAGGRIAGVAKAETSLSDCAEEYRDIISKATFLPGRPGHSVPSYAAVRACGAELAVGTAYAFHESTGVADASQFERDSMHIYAMRATYKLDGDFEDTYEDIRALGEILGCRTRAAELVEAMRKKEEVLAKLRASTETPVRAFVFDAQIAARAFTCGRSMESHMIEAAGGCNVFADRACLFVPVGWEEVARADPEIILVHRFYDGDDGEQKAALLRHIPEMAETSALRSGQIRIIGVKRVFPALDNVDVALQMAKWFQVCRKNLH